MTQVRGCRSSRLEICWLLHVDRIFLRDACLKRDRPVLNHTGQPRILVPSMRLELIRLSSPPPQDGVSTNFTTKAHLYSFSLKPYSIREWWHYTQKNILVYAAVLPTVISYKFFSGSKSDIRRKPVCFSNSQMYPLIT